MPDNQEAMLPGRSDNNGIYPRFIQDGHIDHGQWMMACSRYEHVGTCRVPVGVHGFGTGEVRERQCGAYLIPERPVDLGDGRTDYEATCANRAVLKRQNGAIIDVPGHTFCAPGGRVYKVSAQWSRGPASNHKPAKAK